jgi:hypothetical protein
MLRVRFSYPAPNVFLILYNVQNEKQVDNKSIRCYNTCIDTEKSVMFFKNLLLRIFLSIAKHTNAEARRIVVVASFARYRARLTGSSPVQCVSQC